MKSILPFLISSLLLLLPKTTFSQVKRLVDLCPELTSTYGYYMSRVGNNIYFVGQDINLDTNLYEYGPTNGLKKINGSFLPSRYWGVSFYFQNASYFWGYETNGMDPGAMFSYDGNGNAVKVDKLGNQNGTSNIVIFKNKLFYPTATSLYSFDGIDTINCTGNVGSIQSNVAATANYICFFTYLNNELVLCKYDGNTITLYKNINLYNCHSVISYNNDIYFDNTDPSSGYQLWKFDGNTIYKLTNIGTHPQGLFPGMFSTYKANLCFEGSDQNAKSKIWLYNDSCGAIPIHDYSMHSGYANTKVIDTDGYYLYFVYDNYNDSKIGMFHNNQIEYVPLPSHISYPLTLGATSIGLFFTANNSNISSSEIFYYKPPSINGNSINICEVGKPPALEPEFVVYPNPIGFREFDIKTNEKIKEVYLVDVLGRTYYLPPQAHYELDLIGLYLIFVKTESGTLFKDRIVFQ